MQTDYQVYSDGNCNDDDDSITIESCPSFCPGNYQPVCGKNNFGEKRTFSNECRLKSENCLKKSGFVIVSDGECVNYDDGSVSCPTICPANYQPICATNSNGERKTFSNECQLNTENCSRKTDFIVVSDGECTSVTLPVDDCPRFCPALYQPVCAVNGYGQKRNFGSSCLVTVENCSKNGGLFLKFGKKFKLIIFISFQITRLLRMGNVIQKVLILHHMFLIKCFFVIILAYFFCNKKFVFGKFEYLSEQPQFTCFLIAVFKFSYFAI